MFIRKNALNTFILLAAVFHQSVLMAQAPNYKWGFGVGSANNDESAAIATDQSGNVIIASHTYGSGGDFDPGSGSTSSTDGAHITKYDAAGNLIWHKTITSSTAIIISDLVVDSGNNIYYSGGYYTDADLDPGPGTISATTSGYAGFISKLDSTGNLVYCYYHEGLTGGVVNRFGSLVVSASGIVSAVFYQGGVSGIDYDLGAGTAINDPSTTGFLQGILQLNTSGSFLSLTPTEFEIYDLAISPSGSLFLAGVQYGPLDVNPGAGTFTSTLSTFSNSAIIVVYLSSTATFDGYFKFENNDYYITPDAITFKDGKVIVAGNYSGETNFGTITGTPIVDSALYNLDGFIASYDYLTTQLDWVNVINSVDPLSYDVACYALSAGENEFYLTGRIEGYYDLDGSASTQLINNTADERSFVAAYDASTGQYKWSKLLGFKAKSVCTSPNLKDIYFHGDYNAPFAADMDSSVFIPSIGSRDMYVIKWSNCHIDTSVTVAGVSLTANESASGTTYQWYDCSTNILVPGAINAEFTPIVNGSYYAEISKGGCVENTNCYTVTSIGLNELTNFPQVRLFPNPAQNEIRVTSEKTIQQISLFNQMGQMVFAATIFSTTANINIEQLPSGVYEAVVYSDSFQQSIRIIKE